MNDILAQKLQRVNQIKSQIFAARAIREQAQVKSDVAAVVSIIETAAQVAVISNDPAKKPIDSEIVPSCTSTVLLHTANYLTAIAASRPEDRINYVLRAERIIGDQTRFDIKHDALSEAYLYFATEKLRRGSERTPLLINGRHMDRSNPMPVTMHVTQVGPKHIVALTRFPLGTEYAMQFYTANSESLPDTRVALRIKNMSAKPLLSMTPLVRTIVQSPFVGCATGGTPAIPDAPASFKRYGVPKALTYVWGEPGAGKTDYCSKLVTTMAPNMPNKTIFVLTETNSALLTFASRLNELGTHFYYAVSAEHSPAYRSFSCAHDRVSDFMTYGDDYYRAVKSGREKINIILTTVNKFLSPTTVFNGLVADVVFIDEISQHKTINFLAICDTNPEIIVMSGDHYQYPPFADKADIDSPDAPDVRQVEMNPIHYFGLSSDAPVPHMVRLPTKLRMPLPFATLFKDVFYDGNFGKKAFDYPGILNYVGFWDSPASAIEYRNDANYAGSAFNPNSVSKVLTEIKAPARTLIITPYRAQCEAYTDVGLNAVTIMPSQGMGADFVVYDMVRDSEKLHNNYSFVVAMSRFKKLCVLVNVPPIPARYFTDNFNFDTTKTLSQNMIRFVECTQRGDWGCGRCIGNYDLNGNYGLLWLFFIYLLGALTGRPIHTYV